MADLLAIISHDRGRPVPASALAKLSATYESLRGAFGSQGSVGCGWARVQVIDHAAPAMIGVEHDGEGFSAWAGPINGRAGTRVGLESLDGQFALVRLDQTGTTLRVVTDPLGMKPLFTARTGELTYVSTSALVLAKHLRSRPSRSGLERFLRTGSQFGCETPWEGITRMQPATALNFTPRGAQLDTYWLPAVEEDVHRLDFAECAEVCIGRAVEAMSASYQGAHPWLDLTGGFDTRLLALLARQAALDFDTNTSGKEDSDDVRLARRIAEKAGWSWTHFRPPDGWSELLPARLTEAVVWGDCHLDAISLSEVMQGHRQRAQTETMLLNGGGGEHFRDYPWSQELLSAGRSTSVNLERLIAWRALTPIDLSIFESDPTPRVSAGLRSEFEARIAPFSSLPNTFQCDLLYALKATGHFGAYQAAAGAWMHVELPFYLKASFTTAISAQARHRNFHRLMRKMMQRLDPVIAAIATDTGGPAEPLGIANLYRFAPYPWRRGKRFLTRIRGGLAQLGGGASDSAGGPGPREAALGQVIGALREQGRLVPGQMRSGKLYDQARLAQLLDRAISDPAGADWSTVGRVLTVELALDALDSGLG